MLTKIIKTLTPATLITGKDEKGNETGFFLSSDGDWYNLETEQKVTTLFVTKHMIDLVIKVRFGDVIYTRLQWIAAGCPFVLES